MYPDDRHQKARDRYYGQACAQGKIPEPIPFDDPPPLTQDAIRRLTESVKMAQQKRRRYPAWIEERLAKIDEELAAAYVRARAAIK